MTTTFEGVHAKISMGYHEIELYNISEANYILDVKQYFM